MVKTLRVKPKRLSLARKKQLADLCIQRWKSVDPDPKCELTHNSPFQLLVSVVLSAQTTDKMVNRCMEPLYKHPFTPKIVLRWGQEEFLTKIKTIGLAPTKSKNVLRLCEMIENQFGGEIPRNREDLESLPGVGRKTASVILGEVFREPTIAVDTHVLRVGRRLGLHDEEKAEKAEVELLKVIDARFLPQAHHWLILHGRYTCKARKPGCDECLVSDLCPSL